MTPRIAFLVACALIARLAGAATFAVNTTSDAAEAAGTVGDGICDVGGGQCTLRAALQEANAAPDADTITVPAGTYVLSVSDTGENSTDVDVTNPVTITGAGPLATVIDGNQLNGVFDVTAPATISGLTIRNGKDVTVGGGGVYVASDTTMAVTLRDVQIVGNRAVQGGGLFVDGAAELTVERASITGNTGTTSGGALQVGSLDAPGGTVTLRNVTVSDNVSGLYGVLNEGTLTLEQVTLVGDSLEGSGTTTVSGSILDAGASGTACVSTVVSGGHNLEHGTSCGFAMAGDIEGVDPQLGLLQDNGGGTLTRALSPGSPAVDAGGSCGLSEDQRGKPRPLDGDGVGGAACDAGAYELDPSDQPTSTTTTTTTPGASTTTTTLAPGCGVEATFTVVRCRLDALAARVSAAGAPGGFTTSVVSALGKAKDKATAAETAATSSAKKGKKLLKKASAFVKKARAKIGSKKGKKTFTDATVRTGLVSEADGIRSAMTTLGGTL